MFHSRHGFGRSSMYSRVATFVSIVSGALLGALAALISVTPPRSSTAEPSPPPAAPVVASSEPAATATSTIGGAPDAAPPAPVNSAALDAEKLAELSRSCSDGDPASCLRAAAAWEATGVPGDPARAKDHLERAVRLYTHRCVERDPVACVELAALHTEGRGVEKSERNARALRTHAQVLCRRRPQPACKNVLALSDA